MLENVKHLQNHDKGKTFQVILKTLREELGYEVHYRTIDARHFVPQHRERILIVGFREATAFTWDDLRLPDNSKRALTMKDILHREDGSEEPEGHFTVGKKAQVNEDKYVLSTKLWRYLQNYAKKHKAAGNGFGFGLVGPDDVARTLSARYYKDGSEILISRGRKNPRRLTPRECARLMGFDRGERKFIIPVSDTQAYKQFGNSVVVPVIEEAARIMRPHILGLKEAQQSGIRQLPMAV
jgi:DNA (cytosine-5)-methyltransferase 1